jgi:hypothetical protein
MTTRFRPACVRAARRFGAAARTAACVALSALALPFAAAAQADPRLDELYMLQPHNSYEHGAQLTLWLDAGYRTLELDVQDQEDWWANPRGPYVAHDGGPFNSNCRGTADRLADCLDDIVAWQDAHPGELPIVVFIDMKTRLANALSAWDWWKIAIRTCAPRPQARPARPRARNCARPAGRPRTACAGGSWSPSPAAATARSTRAWPT